MKSETRAVAAFALLGVVLIGVAAFLSWAFAPEGGVSALPNVPAPAAQPSGPKGAPPSAEPAVSPPRLFQEPSVSRTQIAFAFAGEIWTVPREGGLARRLVTGQLRNSRPIFSPDGSEVAFTGTFDANTDVYVVAAGGGEPRRLTYHPGADVAVGFTIDGKSVLFYSTRDTARDLPKLFTVPLTGGLPTELPLPSGTDASYSPDGKRIAYLPFYQSQPGWKKYAGGQTARVQIADLADSRVAKVPRENSNDRFPMWVDHSVYFLSDRNGPTTLFAYDVGGSTVRELVHNPDGFDLSYASAGPDAIVYAQMGEIHLYDLPTGKAHAVPITVSAELPQVRARFEKVGHEHLLHSAISPTGKRVLFEARGEILAIPAEKGDPRNLTRSPGVADRDPAWSPDGKWIAWLSDESGEYALYFRAPDGVGPTKKVDLGSPPTFWYAPIWSPDSKKIVIQDKRLNLWLVDLDHPKPVKIDTNRYDGSRFDAAWSPDSRWIAYSKQLQSYSHAIYLYSLEQRAGHQITDGRSDSFSPRFDKSGKYLWLLASTDVGLANNNGMTYLGRPVTSSVYAVVLRKDLPSPDAPESDEEKADAGAGDKDGAGENGDKPEKGDKRGKGDEAEGGEPKPPKPVKIDLLGIDQRIVAMPIERANYQDLEPGAEGVLFLVAAPVAMSDEDYVEHDDDDDPVPLSVTRFNLKKRKTEKFIEQVDGWVDPLATFVVSADGGKVLYAKEKKWFVVSAREAPKEGEGALKMDGLEVWVDPRAEWRQMFHEIWRIERDFLYDPNAHGLDLEAAEKLYAPYLEGIAGRADFSQLVREMLSNLVLGHVRTGGGALPKQDRVSVGQLGADYRVEEGRYRFDKILSGENWNPKLKAPLTAPGVDVKTGDFLLAVNGKELRGDDDVDRLLSGTAGKQTILTVGPKASTTGSRHVTVVPVPSEASLRLRTWMESNRKKVDEMSGGRVGYVYLPDTHALGYTNFNRYYFAQAGKEAVVLDERFNHGGDIADYIIHALTWTPMMGASTREGDDHTLPWPAIFGPKVMIANEMSGSGGDALPWMFKSARLGPVVGTRTWGGLVGIGNYPRLIDGGTITAPRFAWYGTKGEWEVENHGIAPYVEVEQDPALVRRGHDPQLERAVQIALDELAKHPPTKLARPPFSNYGGKLPRPHTTRD